MLTTSRLVCFVALPVALATCALRPVQAQPAGERVRLRGRVSSRVGQPVAGVVVIVRRKLKTASAAFWGGSAVSDARGEFVLEDAEEGEYEIGGEESGLLGASQAFVPYRLTRTSPPARLTMSAPVRLRLQVLAPDGQRVAWQQLLLMTRHKAEDSVTRYRYDSQPAPSEALDLTVVEGAGLFVSCFAVGWGFVDCGPMPEGSSQQHTLKLQKGGSLRLQAVEEGSKRPVAGALSTIRVPGPSDLALAKIEARDGQDDPKQIGDIANLFHWEARERQMATGPDGALTIQNLRPGFYAVNLTRPGFEEPKLQIARIQEGQAVTCTFTLKPFAPLAFPTK